MYLRCKKLGIVGWLPCENKSAVVEGMKSGWASCKLFILLSMLFRRLQTHSCVLVDRYDWSLEHGCVRKGT